MKSELRGILAVALSVGVLILWYTVIAPPRPPAPSAPASATTAAELPQNTPTTEKKVEMIPSSGKADNAYSTFEPSKERIQGKEVRIENGLVRITLDTMGGIVKSWELKEFTRKEEGDDRAFVSVVDAEGTALDLQFRGANFKVPFPIPFEVAGQESGIVDFRWRSPEVTVWKRLRLDPNNYQVRMEIEVENRKRETIGFIPAVEWTKKPSEESPQMGVLFFKTPPDIWHPAYYKEGSFKSSQAEKVQGTKIIQGDIGWIGAESRYFLGSVVPVGKGGESLEEGRLLLADGKPILFSRLVMPQFQVLPGESWVQKFNVYGGPKKLKRLKAVGPGFEKAIGYGWTSIIAIPLLHLLQFFYSLVHNYGIAIILLTVLIKLLLNPINRKSLKSMKAMQELQPKIKELKKKYGSDKQQMNMQMMQLFKAHKVNPAGGCLPMLLQFPIYIALYKVFWGAVELYHAPFFWFYKDLSAPDPYLIMPVLLGIAMVFQQKMTPNPSADPTQKKIMMIMPLMFCVIMVFLPMGLCLYIFVNTGMTVLQQWMYNKGIRFRDLVRGRINLSV